MSKPVVFVIGASGNVGSATVQVLAEKYINEVEIRAGVRNPDKADKLKAIAGISIVKAEMGSTELKATLRGVDTLFIVTPSVENNLKAKLVISTANSAKEAGVKHQVVVSVPTAADSHRDSLLGRGFNEIETSVKALGVTYTMLRLPMFFENYFGFKDTIKGEGTIYGPTDPSKKFIAASVGDIGKAAAAILVNPANHANKTYTIVSDHHSYGDVAAAFGEALGKTVTYNRISYDAAKLGMAGLPEWQVDLFMEFVKLVDNEDPVICATNASDYNLITGEHPTSLKAWANQVKGAFK